MRIQQEASTKELAATDTKKAEAIETDRQEEKKDVAPLKEVKREMNKTKIGAADWKLEYVASSIVFAFTAWLAIAGYGWFAMGALAVGVAVFTAGVWLQDKGRD